MVIYENLRAIDMKYAFACVVFFVLFWALNARGQASKNSWDVVKSEELAQSEKWFDRQIAGLAGKQIASPSLWRGVSQGWGTFHVGWSVNHLPLKLNGMVHETGVASHADAIVEMTIPAGSKRFTGICGLDDTKEDHQTINPVIFTIEADGKEVWRSKARTALDDPISFDVDLNGIKIITLKAKAVDQASYTPVDWVDLKLTQADGSIHELGQRLDFQNSDGGCFSFVYDNQSSQLFLEKWAITQETIPTKDGSIVQRMTRTDPITGLQCVVEIKRYAHFPVVEWTLRFKNTGTKDTPIIENIRSLDLSFPAVDKLFLHHNTGDHDMRDGYEPHVTELTQGSTLRFAPVGGRPTDKAWPYYNIEDQVQQKGVIAVVGWPGQWSADFARTRNDPGILHITGGQELTHLRLHPGEEIRTPLSVVMFYEGDAIRAQNIWRRWMLEENVPRPNGKIPAAIFSTSLGLHQSQKTELDGIDLYSKHDVQFTHWWMDAGWYPCSRWWDVGTWTPDPTRFPNGIKPVSDVVHAKGMKLILWFEPERVHVDSWLFNHHPEWLLGKDGDSRLLNLGNPAAWNWLVNHLDEEFQEQGVDLYRQDFNMEALADWRANDETDRQGMTEIRHVEGYLTLWDELHRRHPDLLIDTCASGGRRLDLETLRRSVSLWRCDHNADNESNQGQTFGLASWVPLFGSGISCDDPYTVRSQMIPFLALGMDPDKKMDWDLFHRESTNWLKMRDELLGDFYPLLPYSLDDGDWMAWQFDRPEHGTGVVQAFRHAKSPFFSARFPLHGLDPQANYLLTDVDSLDPPRTITGQELLSNGLEVRMDNPRSARIILYQKK
jgi:alpha-galactosidase